MGDGNGDVWGVGVGGCVKLSMGLLGWGVPGGSAYESGVLCGCPMGAALIMVWDTTCRSGEPPGICGRCTNIGRGGVSEGKGGRGDA